MAYEDDVPHVAPLDFPDDVFDVVRPADLLDWLRIASDTVARQVDGNDRIGVLAFEQVGNEPLPTPCAVRAAMNQHEIRSSSARGSGRHA